MKIADRAASGVAILVRLIFLALLFFLVSNQWLLYQKEEVSTAQWRQPAQFPRVTVCPARPITASHEFQYLEALGNGNITLNEFFNITTDFLPDRIAFSMLGNKEYNGIPRRSRLGHWTQKYYLHVRNSLRVRPIRCYTFIPNNTTLKKGVEKVPLTLFLDVNESVVKRHHSLASINIADVAYQIFIHSSHVPNIGDLPYKIKLSTKILLTVGKQESFNIEIRKNHRVSTKRNMCNDDENYEYSQCLKECQWRNLIRIINCKYPFMTTIIHDEQTEFAEFLQTIPPCNKVLSNTIMESIKILPLNGQPNDDCSEASMSERFIMKPKQSSIRKTSITPVKPMKEQPELENLQTDESSNTIQSNEVPFPPPPPPPVPRLPQARPKNSELFVPHQALTNTTNCNCLPQCREEQISVTRSWTPGQDSLATLSKCLTSVQLWFDFSEERTQESLSYTSGMLLANIGGFIGLITGYSIFTAVEFIVWSLKKLPCHNRAQVSLEEGRKSPQHAHNDTPWYITYNPPNDLEK